MELHGEGRIELFGIGVTNIFSNSQQSVKPTAVPGH